MRDGSVFSLLFFLAILAMGGAIYAAYAMARKRHQRNLAWAHAHGWNYLEKDQNLTRFSSGAPFQIGTGRSATEVLWGMHQGWTVISFTYQWTVKQGKSSQTYTRHILGVQLGMHVPRLDLSPDNALLRKLGRLAGQDIQFESVDFNNKWRVACRDLRFAHDVVHPRMMEHLLHPHFLGREFRYENTHLMTWVGGRTNLDRILPLASDLISQTVQLPTYLRDADR